METKGQKIGKLLDALDDGFIITKDHQKHPEDADLFPELEYMFKDGTYYELRGWASALGDVKDRLLDIIQNPDAWKIFPNFNINKDDYPYPWSTKYTPYPDEIVKYKDR